MFSPFLVMVVILHSVVSIRAAPAVTSPAPVPIVSNAASIAAGLKAQPSVSDRLKKLLTDSEGNLLTGDALRQLTVLKGGSSLLATPCGLSVPHMHPRANEFLTVVEGILDTGFVQENGFPDEVRTRLGKYQGTVFPMGMHYQQNPTCSPAMFVGAANSEDPGCSDMARSLWMLPPDVVDAGLGFPHTIGGHNINAWRAHLPGSLTAGVDSCLKACGLAK
ncbi:spherulin-1B precursor [Mycena pura]|uniref:Spherulin-1B n=1 Tax=Mycena pura TaxID=153505 RepID=A0AAD6YRL0_9AGAR|nr:spherulin-1B precursor [Mycena pura]